MNKLKLKDGVELFYKDWGKGQPLVFHHGWPLSGDDWDTQMLFFLEKGYRVIAHDRRGHGRSSQTYDGNDMDTYANDVAQLVEHLDLKNSIHIGHSTGGGEAIRYANKFGKGRVAKVVLISAVTPYMIKDENNPNGVPLSVFDDIRKNTANDRLQFYKDITIPFYGYNRDGAVVKQGIQDNWWRQGVMGSIKAHYDCIRVFSETDFSEDLKNVDIPVLILHGEDDQIVPYEVTALRAAKLVKNGKLITYPGFPHGMPTTEAETINKDILEFIEQ
ncbi:MAG TPA: alpha/beta hydrolase [Ignavibacteria bacterium]|nr:alpha/beta hydrolase [Ignavibacteria bacterium]